MKGRRPPDALPGVSVQTHADGATFAIPENAIQPDGFGIQGISGDDGGFVLISPEGAPMLIFDLETAKTLADAIRFAVAKVEQGMRERGRGKTRTTPSA